MTLTAQWGKVTPATKRVALAANYAAGTNIPGVTVDLTEYNIDVNGSSVPDVFVYLNGRLLIGGNLMVKNDVYPGDDASSGDLKTGLPGGVHSGDVFMSVAYW